MLIHIDNFEHYSTTGRIMNSQWISRQYEVHGSPFIGNDIDGRSRTNLGLQNITSVLETRTCLQASTGNSVDYRTGWALLYPLSTAFLGYESNKRVAYMGFKLLNVGDSAPRGEDCAFGLVHRKQGVLQGVVLTLAPNGRNRFRIYYSDGTMAVKREVYLPVPLFGSSDLIEISIEKENNQANQYSLLNIWVNNRIIFSDNVVSNVGEPEDLFWGVLGTFTGKPHSTSTMSPYISTSLGNTGYGFGPVNLTDFYMCNNSGNYNTNRLGRVKVVSRVPSQDAGPNQWDFGPSTPPGEHNYGVSSVIPDTDLSLQTAATNSKELFGGGAFPDLGSELVFGVLTRVVAMKEDPLGPDVRVTVDSQGNQQHSPTRPVLNVPTYVRLMSEVNPANNLNWNASDANNSKFGFESMDPV